MIIDHLPIWQVILPLIMAPIVVILHQRHLAWVLALAVSWASFAVSIALLVEVGKTGVISYHVGGWAPPWGIEIRVDLFSAFVLTTVSFIGATVIPYARASIEREVDEERHYLFYAMYLLCLAGLLGIPITGDVFNLFVFLEISSLSSYVLISLSRDRRALVAAFRYLIMGTIGATFYIIGVGLMYMMTGSLNMVDLAQRLPSVEETRTAQMALAFVLVGLGLKVAVFPLHMWLPNAYSYAPNTVTVFIAGTSTKVAFYALIRILFTVFGAGEMLPALPLDEALIALAVISMLVPSVVAVFQTDVKRLLAYSSISQLGYMVLGMSMVSVNGLAGSIVHIFNHAIMKAALFMAVGCVFFRLGSSVMKDIAGFGHKMPVTAGAIVLGGFSLIGAPLSAGFVTKWFLLQGAIERDWWIVAAAIILSGLLALVYMWRMVECAYFGSGHLPVSGGLREAPASMLIPLLILCAANLFFGIDGTLTGEIAESAATSLMGIRP